ncbi:Glycosyltransferase [Rhynchospora pubera]|uniref:Glycosyltransferase n=1 Tax=Rhynchospora pubera TaxID=906938 RepID=A0AAV8EXK8_9POAL|nr:Glycosyltransferase [Rhynchospora pubera]
MASSDNLLINSNHANTKKWRVFVFPYFARGHLIPMTDFARLLSASHPDIEPTMVVTPGNTSFITSSLGKSNNGSTQQPVQILTYPFPSIGLKSNHETVGIGTSTESSTIDQAFRMVRVGQEQFLGQHKPDAVIVDAKFPWIATTAANLGIPCLFFLTSGVFPLVVCGYLSKMRAKLSLHDYVTISGLPGPEIRMPALELPGLVLPEEENYARYVENTILKSWLNAFGIVVNTFHGLESEYCNHFEKTHAKRAYFVGPVSLSCKTDQDSILGRGGKGTLIVWGGSITKRSDRGENESEWVPEGWEERIGDKGLVVRGWVPQVAILAHAATGAFMTHCGWNSLLESTAAGVPMLTWPFAAEQFVNEKLVVEMVGCAARLWEGGKRSTRETESELVPRTVIARAVSRFMEPGGEYSSVHCKAREIGAVARSAMADGGSSTSDLSRLINDLINAMQNKTCS